ncbi:Autophagy-related protein [Pleurostoma richardsiae]|uniref:Autophagy-related protein 29 n=1 Tax=Pleurostoma richardsiae TaxID=41990 RepID=A0AA38VIX0_9PEZI|nr:Autophagy-related protein [Pleurostoma richardsiae]
MDTEPTYTVYVRLPFPRGDFVDPPTIRWDASKDEELWKILSGATKTDIEWNELATTFQVTVDFLLQQATYLTERHASQVRAQMRKAAAAKGSAAPSPIPGSDSTAAAEAMRRTGSGGGRAPSSLSIRKADSPLMKNEFSAPGTPKTATPLGRPPISRASSANTAVPAAGGGGSTQRLGKHPQRPISPQLQRHRLSSLPITTTSNQPEPEPEDEDPLSPGPAESSSAPSSSSSSPAQSRIIRRPPRFQQHEDDALSPNDDEDDAQPAFLPFKSDGAAPGQFQDPSATLRGDPRDFAKRLSKGPGGRDQTQLSQTSDSSASSAPVLPRRGAAAQGDRHLQGPLSPRRTAELSGKSPATKGKYSREGSDGTPSMGSSFSDLDDASVTQSALEEALASKMQDGGTIGSRMSTISQAFKSRYLPKSGRP